MNRELPLTRAFVELADTLVADYDVADLLHLLAEHCVNLLDAAAAGLLLSDQRGDLQVLASSTEATRLLELFQLQADEGPCVDCYRNAAPVLVPDLAAETDRWPSFAPRAAEAGFRSVHAVPMRLRDQTIGAMNLFGTVVGTMPEGDLRVAQALADIATIGILQERTIHHTTMVTEQLQTALNSRITIEQAKGVLAQASGPGMDMGAAFTALRDYSRNTNTRLSEVAVNLVTGSLAPGSVLQERASAAP